MIQQVLQSKNNNPYKSLLYLPGFWWKLQRVTERIPGLCSLCSTVGLQYLSFFIQILEYKYYNTNTDLVI